MSFRRRPESIFTAAFWMPTFVGMTVLLLLQQVYSGDDEGVVSPLSPCFIEHDDHLILG